MPEIPPGFDPEDVALARAILAHRGSTGRDLWDDRTPDERSAWAFDARAIRVRLRRLGFEITPASNHNAHYDK